MTPSPSDRRARGIAMRQARVARISALRRRVIASALALFVATWVLIAMLLVSGHDPALARTKTVAAASTPATTTTASTPTASTPTTRTSGTTTSTPTTPTTSAPTTATRTPSASSRSSGSSSSPSALTSSQS